MYQSVKDLRVGYETKGCASSWRCVMKTRLVVNLSIGGVLNYELFLTDDERAELSSMVAELEAKTRDREIRDIMNQNKMVPVE